MLSDNSEVTKRITLTNIVDHPPIYRYEDDRSVFDGPINFYRFSRDDISDDELSKLVRHCHPSLVEFNNEDKPAANNYFSIGSSHFNRIVDNEQYDWGHSPLRTDRYPQPVDRNLLISAVEHPLIVGRFDSPFDAILHPETKTVCQITVETHNSICAIPINFMFASPMAFQALVFAHNRAMEKSYKMLKTRELRIGYTIACCEFFFDTYDK